jgi:hypothetical protein
VGLVLLFVVFVLVLVLVIDCPSIPVDYQLRYLGNESRDDNEHDNDHDRRTLGGDPPRCDGALSPVRTEPYPTIWSVEIVRCSSSPLRVLRSLRVLRAMPPFRRLSRRDAETAWRTLVFQAVCRQAALSATLRLRALFICSSDSPGKRDRLCRD